VIGWEFVPEKVDPTPANELGGIPMGRKRPRTVATKKRIARRKAARRAKTPNNLGIPPK